MTNRDETAYRQIQEAQSELHDAVRLDSPSVEKLRAAVQQADLRLQEIVEKSEAQRWDSPVVLHGRDRTVDDDAHLFVSSRDDEHSEFFDRACGEVWYGRKSDSVPEYCPGCGRELFKENT